MFTDNSSGLYTVGSVQILGSGKYKVAASMFTKGAYSLKVYSGLRLIYASQGYEFQVTKTTCAAQGRSYQCPGTEICVNSYYECPYYNSTLCTNSLQPFLCNNNCAGVMATDCCITEVQNKIWCPFNNLCVATSEDCFAFSRDLSIMCSATNALVQYQFDCCQDQQDEVGNPLVKCNYEGKCAKADNSDYCFEPILGRNCSQ